MARGLEAYREQAAAAGERRHSGFASILLLKGGEQVQGRFRGVIYAPSWQYTEAQLKRMAFGDLIDYAASLGVGRWDTAERQAEAILRRYKQEEPFSYEQHYIARNKGRDAYLTCAERWEPKSRCAACHLMQRGDKAISRRDQVVFSFLPRRKFHVIERGGKKEYPYCVAEGGHCAHCNSGNPAKQEGMRYFGFAQMHAQSVIACAERVAKRCSACGIGAIRNVGWMCSNPDCGEPLSYALSADGRREKVRCAECKALMLPDEQLRCPKGCDRPRRAQLFDVDVLVQRHGSDKKTVYNFTEQWPCEPLENELLLMNLPTYEVSLRPRDIDTQCRVLGMTKNLAGAPLVEAPDEVQSESYEDADSAESGDADVPF